MPERQTSFQVEQVVVLCDEQFRQFQETGLKDDQIFLFDYSDKMWFDPGSLCWHCVLVKGETGKEGILVDAEGYSYARYAAFASDCDRLRLQDIPVHYEHPARVPEQKKPGNGKSRSVKRSLAMRKRNHIIPLHLNKKELAHLEAQVKTSGLPREEFLRTLIMGAELRARPCLHHADLLHKVAGLCNNANQLARIANTYGEADQQSIEEMIRLARQIWKEVKNNW